MRVERAETHVAKANARASDAEARAAEARGFECAAARASDADPGWSSYVPALLVVVSAAWFCSLCFVVVRALRLFVRCPPTPRRFRSVCGCFDCSSWSPRRMSRRGAGFRRTSCLIVIICARAAGCCRCCVVPFVVFCDCSCAVPFCAISPHSSSLSIGLWVFRLFILES